MELKNHIPIYLQIIDEIKKEIIIGKIIPGDKLESVRHLATKYKVNPNTVQKAFQEMERSGIAYSKRGIGTFIVDVKHLKAEFVDEMSLRYLESFTTDMGELGLSKSEILERLNSFLGEDLE